VATFSFEQARACVVSKVSEARSLPLTEIVHLSEAASRVLAEPIAADRDYPPTARSVRDGFALRAADLPGELQIIGEVRAGEAFHGSVRAGQAVEIMTGAPVPDGADAVVMVEHTTAGEHTVRIDRTVPVGEAISNQGGDARKGDVLLSPGKRLGFAEIAMLATVGRTHISVHQKPQVAILATGDEILDIASTPADFQIRNSNAYSLAAQVSRAGGCPRILPTAPDRYDATRELIEHGLQSDLLLLSGGVSAGKYDIVEQVLTDLGAEFYFDRVKIQPGQPAVFGHARGKFFFGLPGNPASTMVTFEIFARVALELLGGQAEAPLPLLWTRLACEFHQKPGLTRFLPAHLDSALTPLKWSGSGDIPALTRANAFLVSEPEREHWAAGDWIRVLLK
jgi:molybdopterin molybdotransferase